VRKIGPHPTSDQQRDVILRRAQLQERVDVFQKQAASILQVVTEGGDSPLDGTPVRETYFGIEFDGICEDDDGKGSAKDHDQIQPARNSSTNGHTDAEYISLHLPSHFKRDWCDRNATKDLVKAELRLREGQLNDSLHQIQIALGHKSYIFRHDVRLA
jgi:hypothetical protein